MQAVGVVGAVVTVAFCAPRLAAQAQWTLGPPELTVGQDTDYYFEDVTDVIVREDRVYVADDGFKRIVAFDRSTGKMTATAGRRGEGPGEFRFLLEIDNCFKDTILAWDLGLQRITLFSLDLDHIRTFGLDDAVLTMHLTNLRCAGPGTVVATTRHSDPALILGRGIPTNETWRASHDILLLEPDGSLRTVLGTFLGEDRYRTPVNSDGTGYSDHPLWGGLRVVFDTSPQGFVVGTGERSSLVRYDMDGNLELIRSSGRCDCCGCFGVLIDLTCWSSS